MPTDRIRSRSRTNHKVGHAARPTWSPDGTKIAFGRGGEIWIMNTDGTQRTSITADVYPVAEHPAWSPDGTRIAFTGTVIQSDIYTIRPDGTGLVNVTDTPEPSEDSPDWSPDGSRLAFTFIRGPGEVHVSNADGTSRSSVAVGWLPAWSPDGTRIAFDFLRQTYAVNLDGSQLAFVRDGSYPDWQPIRRAPRREALQEWTRLLPGRAKLPRRGRVRPPVRLGRRERVRQVRQPEQLRRGGRAVTRSRAPAR